MLDVLCVGQAVVDCITRGKEAEPYKENVYRAETIRLHTGGDAVNESKALAAMGFRAGVVCCLGKDIAGDMICHELEAAGVNTDRISRLPIDTPIANLQVASDGSRISVNSGAIRLEGYRVDPASLAGARIVSFASLFRPPLMEPGSIKELMLRARQEGAVICADTKLPVTRSICLNEIAEVLPYIDYFFLNEKEAAYYSGIEQAEYDGGESFFRMAREFRNRGIRNVVIKAGKEGCFVSGEEGEFAIPAIPVEHVLDTTGAGDNFVAGFLSGILEKTSLREYAERGIRRAAESISRIGGNV